MISLAKRKEALGLVRKHPEAPDDPFMTMYDCMVELSKTKKEIVKQSMALSGTVTADDSAAAARVLAASSHMFDAPVLPGTPANLVEKMDDLQGSQPDLYLDSASYPWGSPCLETRGFPETPLGKQEVTSTASGKDGKDDGQGSSPPSYEEVLQQARLDLKKAHDADKAEKAAKSAVRKAKMKEERAKDPRKLAKHWADLVVADLSDSKKLFLKLKEDKMSCALTQSLGELNDRLEAEFLSLQRIATAAGDAEGNAVGDVVARAQKIIDEMRPVFDRGESVVNSMARKAKKRRTDKGGDEGDDKA